MKPKKRMQQLDKRIEAWKKLPGKLDPKPESRYRAGGYRCPGSLKMY